MTSCVFNPKILFRKSLAEEDEFQIACKHFDVIENRAAIKQHDLIIPRYSALPYYNELQADVYYSQAYLANSYSQHLFVASIQQWYHHLEDLTPRTWFYLPDAIRQYNGPFVLKGETNSRKHLWSSHMYAKDAKEAIEVHGLLLNDSMIGSQGIVIREYEPFVHYGYAINGLPITKEFRFFFWGETLIAKGFYWGNQPEVIEKYNPNPDEVPKEFLTDIANRVSHYTTFWVVDIAQHEDGRWRVVELNDASMSGLNTINPEEFYSNLKKVF